MLGGGQCEIETRMITSCVMPCHYGDTVGNSRTSLRPRETMHTVAVDGAIGLVVGVLAGIGSAAFLHSLQWATSSRLQRPWLVWLLPVAGFVIGLGYHYLGGRAQRGAALVFDEMNAPETGVPKRLAPLVLIGATATHLFGGSGGREGAAVQIAAGLSTPLRKHLSSHSQRSLLIAAVAGGFGSVFGVPFAGTVFALEAPKVGGLYLPSSRYRTQPSPVIANEHLERGFWKDRFIALLPAVVASFVGDRVTRMLAIAHDLPKPFRLNMSFGNVGRIIVLGLLFGLVAALFIETTHAIKRGVTKFVSFPPLRLAAGGALVIGVVGLMNTRNANPRDYLGLSLPLIDAALLGTTIATTAFAVKLLFTAITIGSGFPGGEVTPLFCIGACLGNVIAGPLGISKVAAAALGYVVVFGAASNTPISLSILAVEIFGWNILAPVVICVHIATLVKGKRSVYSTQRFPSPRTSTVGT
jgi:H+/Cl- antiporter ClcA